MSKPPRRIAGVLTASALLAGLTSTGAQGQVGHPPESSPYRDLDARYLATLTGGYTAGNGGRIGIGPSTGLFAGVRLDMHLSGPVTGGVGIMYGNLERNVIDPNEAPANRDLGTATQSVILADLGIDLLLAGEKTWHGLAPYAGAGLGLALGGDVIADSSGFRFSTRFMFGPRIGTRWHPARHVVVRLEVRDMFWQLRYPAAFFADPANALGTEPVLDELTMKPTEWTQNPMLAISVGYAFRR